MDLEYKYFDLDDPAKDRVTIQLWDKDADEILGAIFLRKQSFLPDDPNPHTPCWQVSAIDVIEQFRRRGYGTKLYEEAARQANRYGMALCSDVPTSLDPRAAAFWEKQVEKGRAIWEVPGPVEDEGENYDYGRFVLKRPLAPSLSGKTSGKSAYFDGQTYEDGQVYSFEDLPSEVKEDLWKQDESLQLAYGKGREDLKYRFTIVPPERLVSCMTQSFGKECLLEEDIVELADNIRKFGLKNPPVEGEGYHRAMALASLRWPMPYFEVAETAKHPVPAICRSDSAGLP